MVKRSTRTAIDGNGGKWFREGERRTGKYRIKRERGRGNESEEVV